MSGDEFVLLLPGITKESAAGRIAEFRKSIAEALDLMPEPCTLTMSVGASNFPLDSTEAEELLSTAEFRMYNPSVASAPKIRPPACQRKNSASFR